MSIHIGYTTFKRATGKTAYQYPCYIKYLKPEGYIKTGVAKKYKADAKSDSLKRYATNPAFTKDEIIFHFILPHPIVLLCCTGIGKTAGCYK